MKKIFLFSLLLLFTFLNGMEKKFQHKLTSEEITQFKEAKRRNDRNLLFFKWQKEGKVSQFSGATALLKELQSMESIEKDTQQLRKQLEIEREKNIQSEEKIKKFEENLSHLQEKTDGARKLFQSEVVSLEQEIDQSELKMDEGKIPDTLTNLYTEIERVTKYLAALKNSVTNIVVKEIFKTFQNDDLPLFTRIAELQGLKTPQQYATLRVSDIMEIGLMSADIRGAAKAHGYANPVFEIRDLIQAQFVKDIKELRFVLNRIKETGWKKVLEDYTKRKVPYPIALLQEMTLQNATSSDFAQFLCNYLKNKDQLTPLERHLNDIFTNIAKSDLGSCLLTLLKEFYVISETMLTQQRTKNLAEKTGSTISLNLSVEEIKIIQNRINILISIATQLFKEGASLEKSHKDYIDAQTQNKKGINSLHKDIKLFLKKQFPELQDTSTIIKSGSTTEDRQKELQEIRKIREKKPSLAIPLRKPLAPRQTQSFSRQAPPPPPPAPSSPSSPSVSSSHPPRKDLFAQELQKKRTQLKKQKK